MSHDWNGIQPYTFSRSDIDGDDDLRYRATVDGTIRDLKPMNTSDIGDDIGTPIHTTNHISKWNLRTENLAYTSHPDMPESDDDAQDTVAMLNPNHGDYHTIEGWWADDVVQRNLSSKMQMPVRGTSVVDDEHQAWRCLWMIHALNGWSEPHEDQIEGHGFTTCWSAVYNTINTLPIHLAALVLEIGSDLEFLPTGGFFTIGRLLKNDESELTAYLQLVGHTQPNSDAVAMNPEMITDMNPVERMMYEGVVLAYTGFQSSTEPYVGDYLAVPIENWLGVGRVLDPVRSSTSLPSSGCKLMRHMDAWDSMDDLLVAMNIANSTTHLSGRPLTGNSWTNFGAMYSDEERIIYAHNRDDGAGDGGYIQFQNEYHAQSFMVALATLNNLGSGESPTANVVAEPDSFIPAWKDKREALAFDGCRGKPMCYHDEVRCSQCNGRVIVRLPDLNLLDTCKCPHCDTPDAVQFQHLISPTALAQSPPMENE